MTPKLPERAATGLPKLETPHTDMCAKYFGPNDCDCAAGKITAALQVAIDYCESTAMVDSR